MILQRAGVAFALLILSGCAAQPQREDPAASARHIRAERLAQEFVLVDTHLDIPYRLLERMTDISVRSTTTDFDYPRARAGGLDAAFAALYTPQSYESSGGARAYAEQGIRFVEGLVTRWPLCFALARSEADIRANARNGLVSLPLGMENGIPLEGDLTNVRRFYARGVRYITLVHTRPNQLADASMDTLRRWNGLSPFGRQVIAEMNRVGMIIDVSHMSDSALAQTLALSRAPVIASHSACRHFTPGWERNLSDDMIRQLASRGGVVQINFGSEFVRDDIRVRMEQAGPVIRAYLVEHNLRSFDTDAVRFARAYRREQGIPYADVSDVARHIDHVKQLVGVDHVGFGSDFEGLGDDLPEGLKDVSGYPNLIAELLALGYGDEEIQKICSGNFFRVWSAADSVARALQAETLLPPAFQEP
jgi:membrane dipeptidase